MKRQWCQRGLQAGPWMARQKGTFLAFLKLGSKGVVIIMRLAIRLCFIRILHFWVACFKGYHAIASGKQGPKNVRNVEIKYRSLSNIKKKHLPFLECCHKNELFQKSKVQKQTIHNKKLMVCKIRERVNNLRTNNCSSKVSKYCKQKPIKKWFTKAKIDVYNPVPINPCSDLQ